MSVEFVLNEFVFSQVNEFVANLRALSWQKMQSRGRTEIITETNVSSGLASNRQVDQFQNNRKLGPMTGRRQKTG
jgi:hypothetical protein